MNDSKNYRWLMIFFVSLCIVGCGGDETTTVGSPEEIANFLAENPDKVAQQKEIIARRNASSYNDDE